MKITTILLAAALLTSGTAVFAAEDGTENPEAQQEKRICKNEKITGSLTRVRRVCLTQREWDRLAEGTRKNVNDLDRDANQRQSFTNNSFGGTGG